jgi:hypothetical protein
MVSGDMDNPIYLYTAKGEKYFYNYETKQFLKRRKNSNKEIEADSLPLGIRGPSKTKSIAVVKRLGYSSVKPIPGVPRLHYCYDIDRKEYLLKILPPYYVGENLGDHKSALLVVLPEKNIPEDAIKECRLLDRIKEDVESGIVYRELLGYW